MAQQPHFDRSAARDGTARGPARIAPTLDDDATDTFPVITDPDAAVEVVSVSAAGHAPEEWQVGHVVAGRFVLQQRLDKRRYGRAFKALDRVLSEPQIGVEHHVVLEELPPWIAERATFIERLEQLRLYPQSWSHPNIAKVLEFGRDGDRYYFCEQLLEGASLRVVLDASAPNALEEHEFLGILRYVGDALSYAHGKGIVHGDLRLDNVFVTEAYEVKLTGFLPSTEPRAEPVFVEDRSTGCKLHPGDDVYGLACLAYELLTRRHPYDGKTPLEALRAGLAPHPALNLAPPRWQALSRGLALRRERRPATIAELLAGLGVTGIETLRPAPKNIESGAAPPREATPTETTPWPEVTPAQPARSAPKLVAAPAFTAPAARPVAVERRADPFAEIYAEPTARLARSRRSRRRASPVRAILGVVVAAGLATFAYYNHAWLRDRAAGLMESATALLPPRSVSTAAAPRAATDRAPTAPADAGPPAAVARAAAPAATETEAPAAAAPSESAATAPTAPAPAVADPPSIAPPAAPPRTSDAAPTAAAASAPVSEPEPARATAAPPPAPTPAEQPAAAVAAPPRFFFAEPTLSVGESEGTARVVIRRSGSLDEEASVVWWTTDGTAIADEDYAVLGARVARFRAGEDTQVLYIPLIADSLREPPESFVVNLRSERAGGAAERLEVVVLDDDR